MKICSKCGSEFPLYEVGLSWAGGLFSEKKHEETSFSYICEKCFLKLDDNIPGIDEVPSSKAFTAKGSTIMRPFKVGDKVTAFGCEGAVTCIRLDEDKVHVNINNGSSSIAFFGDGRRESWHKEPSLKHAEIPMLVSLGSGVSLDDIGGPTKNKIKVKFAPALLKFKPGKYLVSQGTFASEDEAKAFHPVMFVKLLWDQAIDVEVDNEIC